jgi:hypothetical protein
MIKINIKDKTLDDTVYNYMDVLDLHNNIKCHGDVITINIGNNKTINIDVINKDEIYLYSSNCKLKLQNSLSDSMTIDINE